MSFENSGFLDLQFKYEQKIFKFNVNTNSPPSLSTLISFIEANLINIPITNYNSLQLIFSNEQPKLFINLDTDEGIKLMLNKSKEHSINPINIDIIINEQNNYEENQNEMELINGEELLWSTIIRPNNSDQKYKNEINDPKIVKQKNNLKILPSQNTEEIKDNIVSENPKQELKLQKTPLIMCSVCNTTLINKWFMCVICDNLSENLREGTLTTTTRFILSTHLRNIYIWCFLHIGQCIEGYILFLRFLQCEGRYNPGRRLHRSPYLNY